MLSVSKAKAKFSKLLHCPHTALNIDLQIGANEFGADSADFSTLNN